MLSIFYREHSSVIMAAPYDVYYKKFNNSQSWDELLDEAKTFATTRIDLLSCI